MKLHAEPRESCKLLLTEPRKLSLGPHLFIKGGGDGVEYTSDMHLLDLGTSSPLFLPSTLHPTHSHLSLRAVYLVYEEITHLRQPPLRPRRILANSCLFLFGGYNGTLAFNGVLYCRSGGGEQVTRF
jgi:hypothetical protein